MTKNPEILTRTLELTSRSIVDAESRLVRLSFSSEEPVTRQSFFSDAWVEVLGHDDGEVDLERLNNSAPVLYNHDRSEGANRIGVVERAWLENGRGYAEIRLSRRAEVEGLWQDVRDGILRNVSVAYRINERKLIEEHKDKPDVYRVVRWTPMEISLVDIPADPTVGVGRKLEAEIPQPQPQPTQKENLMPESVKEPQARTEPDIESVRGDAMAEGAKRALEDEKKRRGDIRALFANHPDHDKVRDACLDNPEVDVNEARKQLLDAITLNLYPEGNASGATYWTGDAIVTSIAYSGSFDGIVEATFSFTGTGALDEETVTP